MNICIVAHFAYGMLTGGHTGHAGGVERQTSLMARWLAARGHRVSFLTWDEGQPDEVNIAGVRVIKMCRKDEGIPGLRFFHPRWSSLNRAMKKADAEVYYQNCAEYVTGQVALWCRRHNRRFIYSISSNFECDPQLPELRTLRERVLYKYGLRKADGVIVQTQTQQQMLLNGFGLKSVVLPMPCEGPMDGEYQAPPVLDQRNCRVLWVGRINRVKRLELLLDVAEALPELNFDIAGKPDVDDSYSREVLVRAQSLPNVTVHGMVSREHIPELYKNASFLCCTAIYEGFPNTFLEAWSHSLPIVSTYDPDNLIVTHKLGTIATNTQGLIIGIKTLIDSPALWREMSAKARQHYLENYTVEPVMLKFEKLFIEVLEANK